MLEAMGAGLPVILSHGCNLDPHDAGFVTDVDPAQIAEKLRLLLTDDARRSKMGHAAHDLITAHYTWDKVTEQLDTLYQRFL
jgi:glycosyltransferase involved in cell wall biosynthesis